jgi:hypothetical protein
MASLAFAAGTVTLFANYFQENMRIPTINKTVAILSQKPRISEDAMIGHR